jgi:hypothetical protein
MAHQTGEVTYNFVDMTGRTAAGVQVLDRRPSDRYGACWLVRHACGHERVVRGAQLRASEKSGGKLRCWDCHPKHMRIGE